MAGLCYVGRNVVLADRFGALSVLVGGYVLGILTAARTAVAFVSPSASLDEALAQACFRLLCRNFDLRYLTADK